MRTKKITIVGITLIMLLVLTTMVFSSQQYYVYAKKDKDHDDDDDDDDHDHDYDRYYDYNTHNRYTDAEADRILKQLSGLELKDIKQINREGDNIIRIEVIQKSSLDTILNGIDEFLFGEPVNNNNNPYYNNNNYRPPVPYPYRR